MDMYEFTHGILIIIAVYVSWIAMGYALDSSEDEN
jgi:hypothetical protein